MTSSVFYRGLPTSLYSAKCVERPDYFASTPLGLGIGTTQYATSFRHNRKARGMCANAFRDFVYRYTNSLGIPRRLT